MERPHAAWFPDRTDNPKSKRIRRHLWALIFNGAFLVLFGEFLGEGWGTVGGPLFAVATIILWLDPRRTGQGMRLLGAISADRGVTNAVPVLISIRRHGIFLGRDSGWLGRRGGSLSFEGRKTRFEIMRSDLEEIPGAGGPAITTLRIRSGQGPVEVEFSPSGGEQRFRDLIKALPGWLADKRELPGPPLQPAPRSLWDWRPAVDPYDWKSLLPILFMLGALLSEHFPAKVWIVPLGSAYIAGDLIWGFFAVRQKDNADLARLAAIDSEVLIEIERRRMEADPVEKATARA